MIAVTNLVKRYSGVEAVKSISFHVEKGEIVGFLGPNGAGKSTTMRILTGYLPPTSGEVKIAGLDLLGDSLEVRRILGYMPENVPLYPEMRVEEYLSFRASLKQVKGKEVKPKVAVAMEKCGITDVSRKLIGNLSKGYRQRVGLADALVHDPELLILDEPTAGLDPHQIRSFRQLIRDLGKEHTILLSTHILSEVEMTCSRAIIINRGKIEASDTIENLEKKIHSGSVRIEIRAAKESAIEKIKALPKVTLVEEKSSDGEWHSFECVATPGDDACEQVDQLIKKEGWPLRDFHRMKATLEDVFVELTQD